MIATRNQNLPQKSRELNWYLLEINESIVTQNKKGLFKDITQIENNVKKLIDEGADINYIYKDNKLNLSSIGTGTDRIGYTALIYPLKYVWYYWYEIISIYDKKNKDIELIKQLLVMFVNLGAKLKIEDDKGKIVLDVIEDIDKYIKYLEKVLTIEPKSLGIKVFKYKESYSDHEKFVARGASFQEDEITETLNYVKSIREFLYNIQNPPTFFKRANITTPSDSDSESDVESDSEINVASKKSTAGSSKRRKNSKKIRTNKKHRKTHKRSKTYKRR